MGLHSSIDYYELAKPLDFVSWDNYPKLSPAIPYDSSLAADVMRGLKKQNFLIMEQTAGPLGWSVFSRNPQPGELRKICYQQLAHGADGQIWFRWRSCTVGREQYWHGLLGHDGKAGRRYREAAQVAKEYQQLAPLLAGTTVKADVAIIYDYDSLWALQIQNGYPGASHAEAIKRYYNALFRAGVNVDIVRPGDDLSGYKLVLAPHLHVLADDVAKQLVEYVRGGGVLLADCRTGVKDRNESGLRPHAARAAVARLGHRNRRIRIAPPRHPTRTKSPTRFAAKASSGGEYTAIRYADWITPTTAEPIARYEPAATRVVRRRHAEPIRRRRRLVRRHDRRRPGVLRQTHRQIARRRQDQAARRAAAGRRGVDPQRRGSSPAVRHQPHRATGVRASSAREGKNSCPATRRANHSRSTPSAWR